jgi:osmotically-inducible protein OsmY
MSRRRRIYTLAFALIEAGALAGCAAYRDCGFKGCADDAKITAEVRALFDQHPELEAPNSVHIRTVSHVVYLDGLVDTPFQQQMAASVAKQAAGVTRVVNAIAVSNAR